MKRDTTFVYLIGMMDVFTVALNNLVSDMQIIIFTREMLCF